MEEAKGETFFWNDLKENFIQTFNFIPEDQQLVEPAQQIKQFIQPTETFPDKDPRQVKHCNSLHIGSKVESTRLQLENEHTEGKSFRWKSNHAKTTKPIHSVLRVATTDKPDLDRMTAADFPATFSQFKEGSRPINEAKAPEWLDAKIRTKEVDISNDDRPKIAKIGD